jgi:hypothetical protein
MSKTSYDIKLLGQVSGLKLLRKAKVCSMDPELPAEVIDAVFKAGCRMLQLAFGCTVTSCKKNQEDTNKM